MLSSHPSTAKFIATKLCRRFVCDDPPPGLVKKVADRFLSSDGDIRETLKAIFTSEEFFDPRYYQAKVKTPLEFVMGTFRAAGTNVIRWDGVVWMLEGMGEPLYRCEPPTGYPDTAKAWVSSAALLSRANFAWDLFSNPYSGYYRTDLGHWTQGLDSADGQAVLNRVSQNLLNGAPSPVTAKKILERLKDPAFGQVSLPGKKKGVDLKQVAALVAASPDFQRK